MPPAGPERGTGRESWPEKGEAVNPKCEVETMVELDFTKAGGLVSAIAQDARTGEVLMIAWMNREAFEETVRTRRAVYFSRSRNRLWRKGEESGHFQEVKNIAVDCDNDAVLLKVDQIGGAACHAGYKSCFFRELTDGELTVIAERVVDPDKVYGAK